MIKNRIVLGAAVISIFGSTFFAVMPAYASNGSFGGGNFFSGLIQFIANKFGLDQNQVKSAVTDYRNQQKQNIQAKMQNREKVRLDQLVKDGKITSDQEKAILNEIAALRTKYNPANIKGETLKQRQQNLQNMQNDWKNWASQQKIDPNLIRPFGRGERMSGFRGRGR
ncbi:MAG: hypothetical protein M1450_03935 [Patescibacteria group bacterium]|nr:hypothetical protein [Patescibacteria group bacterium]